MFLLFWKISVQQFGVGSPKSLTENVNQRPTLTVLWKQKCYPAVDGPSSHFYRQDGHNSSIWPSPQQFYISCWLVELLPNPTTNYPNYAFPPTLGEPRWADAGPGGVQQVQLRPVLEAQRNPRVQGLRPHGQLLPHLQHPRTLRHRPQDRPRHGQGPPARVPPRPRLPARLSPPLRQDGQVLHLHQRGEGHPPQRPPARDLPDGTQGRAPDRGHPDRRQPVRARHIRAEREYRNGWAGRGGGDQAATGGSAAGAATGPGGLLPERGHGEVQGVRGQVQVPARGTRQRQAAHRRPAGATAAGQTLISPHNFIMLKQETPSPAAPPASLPPRNKHSPLHRTKTKLPAHKLLRNHPPNALPPPAFNDPLYEHLDGEVLNREQHNFGPWVEHDRLRSRERSRRRGREGTAQLPAIYPLQDTASRYFPDSENNENVGPALPNIRDRNHRAFSLQNLRPASLEFNPTEQAGPRVRVGTKTPFFLKMQGGYALPKGEAESGGRRSNFIYNYCLHDGEPLKAPAKPRPENYLRLAAVERKLGLEASANELLFRELKQHRLNKLK